jgi:hypothetical protein
MIGLTRFQLAGFLRSLRVIQPLLAMLLMLVLVLMNLPTSEKPEQIPELIVGGYGDTAALMFPIWAWTARVLLDTEPDGQRELTALAAGRPFTSAVAALIAAYLTNVALTVPVLAPLLIYGTTKSAGAALPALLLHLLAAAAATLVGAFTTRALIPSQAVSILALLAACVAVLLMGLGPLSPLAVPMVAWLQATSDGATAFTNAMPTLATHLLIWSTITTAAYLAIRHHRI